MSSAVAIVAFPATAAVIWALLRSPATRRLVAVPSADRWHDSTTPSFGGIGIFIGFSLGLWTAAAVGAFDPTRELAGIWAGIALVFAAGLVDDLRGLSPLAKLAAQGAAAAIVLATGTHVHLVSNQIVGDAIAVVWLIGLTNAFNLLDNMDGLAASLASISFFFFAVDAVTVHPDHSSLAYAIAGAAACVGFLPYNLPPKGRALVFMGDSGSQALGFALAALGLVSSWRVAGTTVATLILPVLVLAVPILDTTLVTIARMLDGRPIHQGGRDHSSHRLVRYGLSERSAVALLALIAFSVGGSSLAYNVLDNWRYTVIGVVVTFALLIQFASFLADADRRPQLDEPISLGRVFCDALAAPRRGRGRLPPDQRLVRRRLRHRVRLARVDEPAVHRRPHAAGRPRRAVPGLHPVRALPLGVAIRRDARRGRSRSGRRRLRARSPSPSWCSRRTCATSTARSSSSTRSSAWSRSSARGLPNGRLVIGSRSVRDRTARRTLIVGAGRTGRSLMRELRETAGERVVGFVDDNPRLRRRSVHGVKVIGTTHEIGRILESTQPDIVLVTIPDAPRDLLDSVVGACAQAEVTCRFVRRELDLDPYVEFGAASE